MSIVYTIYHIPFIIKIDGINLIPFSYMKLNYLS